jgi:hypothetical protein
MNAVEREHPVWAETFSEQMREQQLQDDSSAWHAVTGILLTIVSVGLGLAVLSVWLCS